MLFIAAKIGRITE